MIPFRLRKKHVVHGVLLFSGFHLAEKTEKHTSPDRETRRITTFLRAFAGYLRAFCWAFLSQKKVFQRLLWYLRIIALSESI
jgi:hypothetical protein